MSLETLSTIGFLGLREGYRLSTSLLKDRECATILNADTACRFLRHPGALDEVFRCRFQKSSTKPSRAVGARCQGTELANGNVTLKWLCCKPASR